MSFVNVGAYVNGVRPASKKALKDAVKALEANQGFVSFDPTAAFGGRVWIKANLADIGTDKLSVAGPDPYTNRKWYATVEVKNGKIVVS